MKKKVVFIEDEEDIRFVVSVILEQAGYEVESKSDPFFLNKLTDKSLPDLFLLDRHVNGEDMLKVSMKIKETPALKQIPVIMISADPHIKDLYKNGLADGYVAKPFKREELLTQIEAVFR